MKLIINGEIKIISGQPDLTSLVNQLCPNPKLVIAELNGQIIKCQNWNNASLKDEDKIELVTFVGGG
ncbi:MAG: sulfur carrier protein ThiS [Candidatus Omnitrophica bacterium]|nr:sulfur carrier protein ThiS [Candidatus Omnitrophota bacterium]